MKVPAHAVVSSSVFIRFELGKFGLFVFHYIDRALPSYDFGADFVKVRKELS
jgi:hypothetical protein